MGNCFGCCSNGDNSGSNDGRVCNDSNVDYTPGQPDRTSKAASMVEPFSDGVDLNCGCPQRWAAAEGVGACLLDQPELVHDMLRATRRACHSHDFTVSAKIRVHDDLRTTVELCRRLEAAGVDYIAVHGRTRKQRSEPVNLSAIREVVQSVRLPVLANGDVTSLSDVAHTVEATGVVGVMAARGLLENPAMFAGYSETPTECVRKWIRLALDTGTPFAAFHHHLIFMCEKLLSRPERRVFNALTSTAAVIDFIRDSCGIDV